MRRVLMLACAALMTATTATACSQGNVFSLKVGDCFNQPSATASSVSNVPIVPCTGAHDAEVYFVFDYPNAPASYPGDEAVRTAAENGCKPAFTTWVGLDFDHSIYGFSYLRPTSDSWDAKDRTIDCVIVSSDENPLTGSAKGTKK
jgi:hypothetical protein